jgi:hypothetical protein
MYLFPGSIRRFGRADLGARRYVETAIDREAAGHEASLAALLDNLLKQHAVDVARDKPAMAVLGEGRMIRTAPSNPSRQNQR